MNLFTPQPKGSSESITNEGRAKFTKIAVISAAIILPIALLATAYAFSPKQGIIPQGVYVGGASVGGLTTEQAEKTVLEKVGNKLQDNKITLVNSDVKHEATFSEFDTKFDVKSAVNQAGNMSKSTNFFGRIGQTIGLMFKNKTIDPDILCDKDKVQMFVDNFANEADDAVTDETYKVEGSRLKMIPSVKGNIVDRQEAQKLVVDAVKEGKSKSVEVKKVAKEPKLLTAKEIYSQIATPPVNSKLETRDGVKYLAEHKVGIDFDVGKAQEIIDKNRSSGKTYYIPLIISEPKIKTWDLQGDLFKEVICKYDSKLTNKEANRLNNVKLAASKINGTVIQPGEEFSYNSAIGNTTEANGYKKANIYLAGKVEQGVGGGVCQVSSTLYSALLYSDIQVTKRFNHSMIVTYVPFGMDATVSNAQIDLRFKNTTKEPLKVTASVDDSYVHVVILGAKPDKDMTFDVENKTIDTVQPEVIKTNDSSLPAGKEAIDQKGMVGYTVETYKIYKKGGAEIKRQYIGRSKYNVLNRLVRIGTGPAEAVKQEPKPEVIPQEEEKPVSAPVVVVPQPVQPKPEVQEEPTEKPEPIALPNKESSNSKIMTQPTPKVEPIQTPTPLTPLG